MIRADGAKRCASKWSGAAEERSSSNCWTAATCATGTSNARTNKRWSYSCLPKGARTAKNLGRELELHRGDSAALPAWKQRMASEEGQKIYRQRAATSETINADLRSYRGLTQITVRGLNKARCVALGCALAYNLMHFATALQQ